MAKEAFRDWNPRGATLELLQKMQGIVSKYQAMGIRMTLRQLYYQLVAAAIIPNNEKTYKKLSEMLTSARMAGMVDWNAIEDRVRVPHRASQWDSASDIMNSAIHSFRLPRHKGQPRHLELWAEKDAISSILKPICDKYHVFIMVNRGYSSASAMYDNSKRFMEAQENGQTPTILYLGDHDPSGLDMDRDIKARMEEFGVNDLEFVRIGLTDEQIEKYNPPPNPTKVQDPRAAEYIEKYGGTCWEVDALRPEVLNDLVTKAIEAKMDMALYEEVKKKEEKIKMALIEAGVKLDEKFGTDDEEDDEDLEDEEDDGSDDDEDEDDASEGAEPRSVKTKKQ